METLILSTAFEPMRRLPWQRAMVLLAAGRVEVIEEYSDRTIRTVRFNYPMPSVVRFVRGLRWRAKHVTFSRRNMYARDEGRCQYCARQVPRHLTTWDHVIPRSRGGKTTWTNIVVACLKCNQRKANRTPDEAKMPLRRQPIRPAHDPNRWGSAVTWQLGMPLTWRQYLLDRHYWEGALDSDGP
jgi:5-methylcytosine-specific restriction endonuclease McrA